MRLILILILLPQFNNLRCQEVVQKNNFVYLEGLGSGGYYSLNYEKTLFKGYYSRAYLRAGLGVTYDSWIKGNHPNEKFTYFLNYNFPMILGNEIGKTNLKYEYGLGLLLSVGENIRHYNMLVAGKNSKYDYFITGVVGLRYYCKKQPIFFRLTATPWYEPLTKTFVPYWVGASVGYAF